MLGEKKIVKNMIRKKVIRKKVIGRKRDGNENTAHFNVSSQVKHELKKKKLFSYNYSTFKRFTFGNLVNTDALRDGLSSPHREKIEFQ